MEAPPSTQVCGRKKPSYSKPTKWIFNAENKNSTLFFPLDELVFSLFKLFSNSGE
jgi:hypothetical protein